MLFVVTIFIGLPLLVMSWDDLHSWERRFPFPAPQPLTEEVAIDYSGRAFARTRIDMTDAKPAPFYRGRTNIFMFNSLNTNSGSLLWRVPSRGTERGEGPNFTARVSKVGEELVVTLSKHWL
ncbi:MAG: hypothetical protein HY300_03145 [Verrucomicrobia bacterium]|nr:hypothetical protein [Verrucomicrobiota bacterium]